MKPFISHLSAGGLITNYYCTSRCRHCLYGCSPEWDKDYLVPHVTVEILKKIRSLGCTSIHIGGGEPFLNKPALQQVAQATNSLNIHVEYIETNSSWFKDQESDGSYLKDLKSSGITCLLLSISPFHNEFVPFKKVRGLMAACDSSGMDVLPWTAGFVPEVSSFPEGFPHALEEYENKYGSGYLANLPRRFWITFRGRAATTFSFLFQKKSVSQILNENKGGCRELAQVNHFHIDLYGNYIPGLCSGLSIYFTDLGRELSKDRYPFLCLLFADGIKGLYDCAHEKYGFTGDGLYSSKCELCLSIRKYLVLERGINSSDLKPEQFYKYV